VLDDSDFHKHHLLLVLPVGNLLANGSEILSLFGILAISLLSPFLMKSKR